MERQSTPAYWTAVCEAARVARFCSDFRSFAVSFRYFWKGAFDKWKYPKSESVLKFFWLNFRFLYLWRSERYYIILKHTRNVYKNFEHFQDCSSNFSQLDARCKPFYLFHWFIVLSVQVFGVSQQCSRTSKTCTVETRRKSVKSLVDAKWNLKFATFCAV